MYEVIKGYKNANQFESCILMQVIESNFDKNQIIAEEILQATL